MAEPAATPIHAKERCGIHAGRWPALVRKRSGGSVVAIRIHTSGWLHPLAQLVLRLLARQLDPRPKSRQASGGLDRPVLDAITPRDHNCDRVEHLIAEPHVRKTTAHRPNA